MRFQIEGKITGKGRPRFTRNGRTYTDSKTESYECLVRNEYRRAGGRYHDGPVSVNMTVAYQLTKADYNSKGEPNSKGLAKLNGIIKPTKKPDCDNIAKIILDALNGVAYKDDSQVTFLAVTKLYSDRESVKVEIWE